MQAEGVEVGRHDAAADLEGGDGRELGMQLAVAISNRPGGGHDAYSWEAQCEL